MFTMEQNLTIFNIHLGLVTFIVLIKLIAGRLLGRMAAVVLYMLSIMVRLLSNKSIIWEVYILWWLASVSNYRGFWPPMVMPSIQFCIISFTSSKAFWFAMMLLVNIMIQLSQKIISILLLRYCRLGRFKASISHHICTKCLRAGGNLVAHHAHLCTASTAFMSHTRYVIVSAKTLHASIFYI